MKRTLLFFFFSIVLSSIIYPQKITANLFGDYYWAAQNHNETQVEHNNGFWLRRVYFTYDQTLHDNFSMRFRLEMQGKGDFKTDAPMDIAVKDAYLKWKLSDHDLMAGMIPTAAWEAVEQFWGYRWIEKTPLDLYKISDSRDFGISFKRDISSSSPIGYQLMIANGSATRPERNIGKKFIGVFLLEPAPASLIQCYADYNDNAGSNDTMTFTMYAGWKGKGMQFGLQGFYQQRKLSGNATNISGASLSATVSLNDSMNIVTRVDRLFSTNPSGDKISFLPLVNDSKYTYVLLAFDWKISNELRISPNAEMVFYDIKYKPDYFLRLTFYTAMN